MVQSKNTVLYVDDEETNLLLFDVIFSEYFNVLTTTSTEKAFEMLSKNAVKVVISDLRMPEESGLEFIKRISPHYPDIYYIILTAFLDVTAAMQAINQGGVYRYLLKPWDNNEILLTLNNAILAYDLKAENRKLVDQIQIKNLELEKVLTSLREREKQFFNIFYSSSDAIVIFNKDKVVLLANPAFYNNLGLSDNETIKISDVFEGKHLELFHSRFDDIFDKQLPIAEYVVKIRTGETKYIEANSTHITYFGEEAILSVIRDVTERRMMSQRILNEVVLAEERERNRLASDLHDGLGPILSTLKMYIEWLSDKTRQGNSDQILELSNKTIQEAISQLRAISHNLSPHILEKFGLLPALQSQLDMIKTASQINFILNTDLKVRLPSNIEITLFRVIKECITNSIKHSQARKAHIDILKCADILKVNYTDDGVGFDIEKIKSFSKGIGLYNIQNRIQSVGGEVDIVSQPGKGIGVRISIKL